MAIEKLYNDGVRRGQLKRFQKLEPQCKLAEAKLLRERMLAQVAHLAPPDRPPIPSARILAMILGLFCTGATVKKGKIHVLELASREIARMIGAGATQVKHGLSWLGSGDVKRRGEVVARGLGIISTEQRFGKINRGAGMMAASRTARRELTEIGKQLLGLLARRAPRTEHKVRRATHLRCAMDAVGERIVWFTGQIRRLADPVATRAEQEYLEWAERIVKKNA